ncbi:MAG TPA: acylphosphatase [Thermoplasmatales archaeon]|nr:acylphosphatase [Thermoplasmatales archaeon]
MKRAHVLISGRVQGVWFRASTRDRAESLHLSGWVRNLVDGRVEAVFEGDDGRVDEMVKWCHEGPPMAVVEDVEVGYGKPQGERGFEIRY